MMPRPLPPWSWHGVVAGMLAFTLGGGYAAVLVIEALQREPLPSELLQFLTNLGSILAGALAGWLGGSAVADDQRRQAAAELEQLAATPADDDAGSNGTGVGS